MSIILTYVVTLFWASIELITESANCLWFVFMVFHFLALIAWDKHFKMFISMTSCTKLSVRGFSHHIRGVGVIESLKCLLGTYPLGN